MLLRPCMCGFGIIVLAAQTVLAVPDLVCNEPKFNFGQTVPVGKIEHTFVLFNAGDAEIQVSKVDAACGCTATDLKSKSIAPGQSVDLGVKLNLEGQRGILRKGITIESNDPDQPKLTLYLEGEVQSLITLAPAQVFLGQCKADVAVKRTVNVTIDDRARLNVHSFQIVGRQSSEAILHDGLSVQIQPVTAGTLYQVDITFNPGGKLGKLDAIVRLKTDNEQFPTIDIPVSAVVAGELSFAPQSILVHARQVEPVTRYLLVTRNRQDGEETAPFQVKKVSVPLDSIDVEVKPVGKYGYRIRLSNLLPAAELVGKQLVIETDVPSMPKLMIPFKTIEETETAPVSAKIDGPAAQSATSTPTQVPVVEAGASIQSSTANSGSSVNHADH